MHNHQYNKYIDILTYKNKYFLFQDVQLIFIYLLSRVIYFFIFGFSFIYF